MSSTELKRPSEQGLKSRKSLLVNNPEFLKVPQLFNYLVLIKSLEEALFVDKISHLWYKGTTVKGGVLTMIDTQIPIGIFLLDGEEPIRTFLRDECPEEYQILGEAATCKEARGMFPQLISFEGIVVGILDGTLPDGRGEDIALELKQARPDILTVSFSGDHIPQTWADANFQKPGSMLNLWRDVEELVSQIERCR